MGGFSIRRGVLHLGGFSIPWGGLGGSPSGGFSIQGGSPSGGVLHPGEFSILGVLHLGGVLHPGGFSIQGVLHLGGFSIWVGSPSGGLSIPGGSPSGGLPCDLSHHAFDVTCMLPPHQLRPTNSAAAYIVLVGHVTCKASWDTTPPPVNRITHTCKNITFPQLRLRAVKTTSKLLSGILLGKLVKIDTTILTALHSASTCKACNFLFTSCVRTRSQLSKFALLKNFLK